MTNVAEKGTPPTRGRGSLATRTATAREIVKRVTAVVDAPPEARDALERALVRGPIADPSEYLARIIEHSRSGVWHTERLPDESHEVARAEHAATAPRLIDGHTVGGYRAAPRNGRVARAANTES